ncbi:MAG: DUF4430 domain-containing protein [Clostridia bacterium]|nr:DUF4430 domain-containing protein [Clostridia bacterium]
MKRNTLNRFSRLVLFVLMAALALCFVSCGGDEAAGEAVTFTLTVVGPDGASTEHTVTSDAANLGDALLAEGIIAGEDGDYGLYITTVNGITADYDADGAYWSLYIGEEYAMTGVSDTPIAEGDTFKLVYEVYTAE